MQQQTPLIKDLVLIGGGHSHVAVLRSLGMRPVPGVRLTLISRDVHAPYSGMLPGLIAGHYEFDEAHIDLDPLARFAGARLLHDEVSGLDLDARQVLFARRPPIGFDLVSINIGSSPRLAGIEGDVGSVVPVKPIDHFSARWNGVLERLVEATGARTVAVVGGGAGGVELLLAARYRVRRDRRAAGRDPDQVRFVLLTQTHEILPGYNRGVRRRFERVFRDRGVELLTGERVVAVEAGPPVLLRRAGGGSLQVDEALWVTTAGAQAWPGRSGLQVDERGFIEVSDTLQSLSCSDVFAAGDIAAVAGHPRPKAGVFAVRQGPPLAANLRRRLAGRPTRPFRPQRQFLSLISTGDRYAVASRSRWSLAGSWVWRWKDWIDRRFMERYTDLPTMTPEAPASAAGDALEVLSAPVMRCGGCGSKVGSDLLQRALARLPEATRPEVLIGLDAPDDAAVVEPPPGKVLVHTVDQFRAFVDDPFVFGEVTANHALGDIWAMGAEPVTALALVTVPFAAERLMEEDIYQLLAGARQALDAAGVVLVGGHTGEGAEMALGFAINGVAERDRLTRKRGLAPGDALLLTKPVGTGALFAAAMRGRARGRWVSAALEAMRQSSRAAADCLRQHGVSAMTDVTGFGLLGHLVEMLAPGGLGASLRLDSIPLLPGAAEVTAAGITSSLQPDNLRLRRVLARPAETSSHPAFPLLFDPQTAGGLLAGVPGPRADGALAALEDAGYTGARRIGTVVDEHAVVELI